jgi:hypothetical protein
MWPSILGIAMVMIASQSIVAEIVPPEGWAQDVRGDGVLMVSPGSNETDRVFYTVLPAETFSGSFDTWFNHFISLAAPRLGQASQYSGVSLHNGVLLEVVTILSSTGNKVRAYFLGYDVGDKAEISLILIPQAVSERDPRVITALNHTRLLADRKFLLLGKPAVSVGPNAPTMGGGVMGPGKGFGEGLSGVYFSTGRRYGLTAGSGIELMNDVRLIVVLPDGQWRNNLPERGLEIDMAADRREFGDFWGGWTAAGGVVTATRQNDKTVLDAQNWTKLSPIDGLRTDGVFAREDKVGLWGTTPETELVLRADGTFEDRSDLLSWVG